MEFSSSVENPPVAESSGGNVRHGGNQFSDPVDNRFSLRTSDSSLHETASNRAEELKSRVRKMASVDRVVWEKCGDLEQRIRACCSLEVALHLERVVLKELGAVANSPEVRDYVHGVFEEALEMLFRSEELANQTKGERDEK